MQRGVPKSASRGLSGQDRGKGHQHSPYNEVPRDEEVEREMAQLDSAWDS